MKEITFVTGNAKEAEYLEKYLGFPVKHQRIDLDEIQSLDLKEIVEHKVRQAFEIVQASVIVEDVSLEFEALGRLPGPFIRFFVDELSFETICALLDGKSRRAIGRCGFGYYDGKEFQYFEGHITGEISSRPMGDNGFAWDCIFIPDGYSVTRAQLSEEDYQKVYLKIRPFAALREYLEKR